MNKNVLIINQSAELYGADKAILELIENFPEGYTPIVVLHEDGPLKDLLENLSVQVIKSSVIKVKRGILKPSFFLQLPFEILKSFFTIKKELRGKKIALVHSNATSVFIGAFYAFFFRIPHVWHVHEIIEKPEDGSSGSNTSSKSIENNIKSVRESNHNNPLLIKKRNLKIQC